MFVSGPRDSPVLRPFFEEIPPSVMPLVQVLAELLLAGSCHSTCQFKQFSGSRQFRIVGEVSKPKIAKISFYFLSNLPIFPNFMFNFASNNKIWLSTVVIGFS